MNPKRQTNALHATTAMLLMTLSIPAKAIERDGVKASIGAFFSNIDSSIGSTIVGGPNNRQGYANFESDLLLEDSSTQPITSLIWNFESLHMLSLNYFSLDREGTVINVEEFPIGNKVFKTGTLLTTRLDLDLWQLRYGYSFHQTDISEWSVTAGLHLISFDIGFNGTVASNIGGGLTQDVAGGTGFSNTIPLPNIGTYYTYALAEKLNVRFDAQYFDINVDTLDARMISLDAGINYQHTQHFSLYTGLSYYDVQGKYTQDISAVADIDWDIKLKYWGPQIALGYTF